MLLNVSLSIAASPRDVLLVERNSTLVREPADECCYNSACSLLAPPTTDGSDLFNCQIPKPRFPARGQNMDAIVIGANVSRVVLDPERLTPRRALEALGFMARSRRDFLRLRAEDQQGYNRPSFTDAEWKRLIDSLPPQIKPYDSRQESLMEAGCEECKYDDEEVPDGIYTVSLECGHWFHAHCIVGALMRMVEGEELCPVEKCLARIDTKPTNPGARGRWHRWVRSCAGVSPFS